MDTHSFNLVIEVLLISRLVCGIGRESESEFQSRNRGSFDFKTLAGMPSASLLRGFNLVIEVLLISRLNNRVNRLRWYLVSIS